MKLRALHISASATMILIAILTIAAELDSGFKSLLAGMFFHHWVAKGVIAIIVFVALSLILNLALKKDAENGWAKITFAAAVISGLAIFLFYAWHFFSG